MAIAGSDCTREKRSAGLARSISTWRRPTPFLLALAVIWINVYVTRELFTVESTARMNSMHGFWAAMARWADSAWWTPTWWPYWDAGMPFEYTYAPIVPGLMALIAHLSGVSEIRSLHIVMGLVYCLGPAALYFGLWRLTGSAAWSFVAAVSYSLLSPALLVAPNESFALRHLLNAERLYLIADWDELPHMTALALWPLSVVSLFRIVETRRLEWLAGGALVMAAMVYASAFGATLLVISALCLMGALRLDRTHLLMIAAAGVLTWLAACVAMPPSLIRIIRESADTHGHGWSVKSWTALAVVGTAWAAALPLLHRHVSSTRIRFFVLFTLTCLLIVWLYEYGGRQFIPQPSRYKMELSLGLSVTVAFCAQFLWPRAGRPMQFALCGLAVAFAAEQIVSLRLFAKQQLQNRDLAKTIEYRAARWIDANLDRNARVMMPGSMAQWLNAFSEHAQWTGSSWSTAPNFMLQRAVTALYAETGGTEGSLTWLRVFGVQAIAVSGPESPEFWKPFTDKAKYHGQLDVLWKENDTTLYRVPLRVASLAHVVPETAKSNEHWEGIRRYAEALDAERLPGLQFAWEGRNRFVIRGNVRTGEAVSVQITHHTGWGAKANGRMVPIARDGIGLMWIRPGCSGDCTVELTYSGGAELVLCRWMSVLTVSGLSGALLCSFIVRNRKGRAGRVR